MAAETRIGTTIKRARERKRMSQQDLADALGVSRSAVNAWERNRAWPRNSIGALEELLGIELPAEPEVQALEELVPEDEWEAQVLADPDLPDRIKRRFIEDSRAARAAYDEHRSGRPAAAPRATGQAS